jgi:SAM-dependent methyltransferase
MRIRQNYALTLDDSPVYDFEAMKSSYISRFVQFGYSSKTLFYSKDQLHIDRLEQVSILLRDSIAPEDGLLDVGCGYGDVVPYLPPCRYRGIDIIEEFVAEAQRRNPDYEFNVKNLLHVEESFDWLSMIGIMGTMPSPEDVLRKAVSLCGKGLIVDFIDACKYTGPLNRYDLGQCALFLIESGMRQVRVIAAPAHPWTFIVASKESPLSDALSAP